MISRIVSHIAVVIFLISQAFAACEGPDGGDDSTVVTIPANEGVSVFHYRSSVLASIVEFCVREPGHQWRLVASHGTDQSKWSLLQAWKYPKTIEIKTRAYANGTLDPFKFQTRTRTTYGYQFSWFDQDPNQPSDKIVYCYNAGTGCPASRRVDFP
jgi:hypothetical protein